MLQQSHLLSIQKVLRSKSDAAALAGFNVGWTELQWLSRMREWLFYALLVCPGIHP